MESKNILSLYDQEMRIDPPAWRAKVYRRPGLTYLIPEGASPMGGWVLYTNLDGPAADELIPAVIDVFKSRDSAFEWKVYGHDRPDDLQDRLRARGLIEEDLESLLVLDLESAPDQFWKQPGENIRRITDPEELKVIGQIQAEVWGESFDSLMDALRIELEETPQALSVFLAEADGRPVSCAWIRYYDGRTFAELYGGSTLEDFRGKGLYTALVAARAGEARERGVRFLAVDTSPMSRPILEKLGFVFLTYTQPYVYQPKNQAGM
jgi:GNAT superfamily N-acetyltransferase